MRTLKKIILSALILASTSVAFSQSQYNDASIYSYLGLGMPIEHGSSQALGMGLSGVAMRSMIHGNVSNPALWSATRLTLINGGFLYNYMEAEEIAGKASFSNLTVNSFQVQIPIIREKLGVSMSLMPVTESKYSVSLDSEFIRPGNEIALPDTIRYNIFTRGDGGLNRLEVGFGYQILKNLSVGYGASLIFGNKSDYKETAFYSTAYAFTTETERINSFGYAHRFGMYADFPSPFLSNDYIAIGATATLPVNLENKRLRTIAYGPNETEIEDRVIGNTDLPFEYNVGLAYYPNAYLMLSSEMLFQQWSNYQNFSGFNEEFMKDRVKLGLGFEYAAIRRPENSLFTRFIYRGGVSMDSGHLELNGTDIKTLKFTAGLGIPSPASGSSVDVNFDFGIRGTTSHELVRERIFALRVTFNLSEMMFLQRRLQ